MIQEKIEKRKERRTKTKKVVGTNPSSIIFFVLFFSCLLLFPSSFVFASSKVPVDFPTQVCLRGTCLAVEVADTEEERSRGLQNRSSLPEGEGMLFIFPSESIYRFWMKETLISLDMIWLDDQRKIIGIASDVPPCQQDPCPQYGPEQMSLYVLEANAGYADRLGLQIGDQAVFR